MKQPFLQAQPPGSEKEPLGAQYPWHAPLGAPQARGNLLRKQSPGKAPDLGLPAGIFNFGTQNDLILDCLGEMHKIRAIAGHSYQKIPMQFGVLLCIDQRLPVDDIELNVLAAPSEIGFDQMRKLLEVLCAL